LLGILTPRAFVYVRGAISTPAHVMCFGVESSQMNSLGLANVTSITVDQGVRSRNLTPRQRTIEMTQFTVGKDASPEPETDKKAEQGIDDVLNLEEIEQPEDGR